MNTLAAPLTLVRASPPLVDRAARSGTFVAVTTAVLTAVTLGIAVATPPLSGPLCTAGCSSYPWADAAARFPRDFVWMFPAIPLMVAVVALFICVDRLTPARFRIFSQLGLWLGAAGALIIAADYFVQLAVIPPSLSAGEGLSVAALSQYNPHGVFIALEELGFLLIGAGLFVVARAFFPSAVSWVGITGFVLDVAAFAGISAAYGIHREYRFEIAVISIVMLTLLTVSVLLAVRWGRRA